MKFGTRFALLTVALLSAACSDTVAPHSPATGATSFNGGVTAELTPLDTVRFTITIDPWHSTMFSLGAGNVLTFPAGSVCDPAHSSYGDGQWDKPCTAARTAVTENVTAWLDAHGHAQVDFSPNLRFVPSMLPTGWVTLTFADVQASLDPMFSILYCKDVHAPCVNESKKDPSLLTVRDPITGKVTRRIKHFSGYLVGAGDDSTDDGGGDRNKAPSAPRLPSIHAPAQAQSSLTTASLATLRSSGYILASGEYAFDK
ncbi:MAG TPA: hypothetical protein VGM67_07810 [Gemmatimonadaceae bacterium]